MNNLKAIIGGTVFSGTGAPPIPDGVVLLNGPHITAVDKKEKLDIPNGAQIIDVEGGFVLPGLINAHEHLSWDTMENEPPVDVSTLINMPDAYLALRAARSGANFLRSGVTTVRNLGEVRFVDLEYRRAFDENVVPGPRVLASGPWLVTTHAWITFPGVPTCDGVDEVRKFIRTNLRAGVDVIKIFIGGELLGLCNTSPHLTYITKEELETAINEAHAKGINTTAHIQSSASPGFQWAIDAGLDTFEHGTWFTEDDFSLMQSKGIPLVVTSGWWLEEGLADSVYPNSKEILTKYYERVFNSGVTFAVGVDGRGEIGAMQSEIERLVRFGLDNHGAILAATRDGAKVCDLEDKIGTLEPGKLGDVLVVNGSPLEDITALRNVRLVLKSGAICFPMNDI
jgi:imidazolonepropionase-like amidohydrolase